MQRTPLYDEHKSLGAKVIDFHGWALPVQFSGIIQEHLHTRSAASVFDCSHMGEFTIRGPEAVERYHELVISNIHSLKTGRARYGALLNEQGGFIDDLITMRLGEDELYMVCNAATLDAVAEAVMTDNPGVENVSAETAKIDVQGPKSRQVLLDLGIDKAGELKFFNLCRTEWRGTPIILSRTGYTGELGYEIFMPNELAAPLWRALMDHPDTQPAGLGARDTLRTEMGYLLSGQDMGPDRTPLEAGIEGFVSWDEPFQGKEALLAQQQDGNYERLVPIATGTRRAPRHGFDVHQDGKLAGTVTSGTYGPSVGHGIGLAYVRPSCCEPGTELQVGPRNMPVTVATLPFYTEGSFRS